MEAAPKVKRRIIPTLIGPATSIVSPEPVKQVDASILEKQTKLLGPTLVYKIASGKA